ncbi:MAG TPA: alpha/beta fold hydrolase [Jatrophihabitans sp.]|nr:alpha/beta fold hydrolase [Jatrophihabitans sp.]
MTQVVADALTGTEPIGMPVIGEGIGDLGAAFTELGTVARKGRKLTGQLARIAVGASDVKPDPKDWRFKDPTWSEHPVYRRMSQSYLAGCEFADEVLDDLGRNGRPTVAARFLLNVLESAAAPTNTLIGNPAAVKHAFETGGMSLLRGTRNMLGDLRHNGGMPSMVDRKAYQVGKDLAVTPGAVVDRDPNGEVIQYLPTTDTVHARPVLIVPPPIGRFYFLDLRPGRSFVEYAVSRGLQTFMLSWRNPTKEQGDWDLDDYAARILSAVDVVREVTGSDDVDLIGFCAGGILQTLVLNHLAALKDDRVHTASYAVTMLDFGQAAPIRAFSSPKLLALARWNSGRAGIISARNMGRVFTWMRPNELVWNYWVNNYLMGNNPPTFDILAWNADGTNLPAALHRQFLDIFERNSMCEPGKLTVLGTPVDLSTISVPTFVTAGTTDHLTPWKGCYRTTQLFSGPSTFVLSNAGHIQSLVNPPGNPKATFNAGGEPGQDAQAWRESSEQRTGTWWEHWADWVIERSPETVPAPRELGGAEHPPREEAPGLYVRDLVPAGL